MTTRTNDEIKSAVRDFYGQVAVAKPSGGCAPACCAAPRAETSLALGYSAEDLAAVPEGANMGLGCGNPQAIAGLRAGETVLDLGSGGGFDCFLAAKQVGPTGRVIGVDMTPTMIEKARRNAETLAATNVDFRLGEIEHLPVEDATVDAIISNCVVNLAPQKADVFREAFRVLKPGGRLAIADVVMLAPLPEKLATEILSLTGCVAGASSVSALKEALQSVGFTNIRIEARPESRDAIATWMPGSGAEDFVSSATIEAEKPGGGKSCCLPSCCSPGAAS